MYDNQIIIILRDCARKGKTLAETSVMLHRPEMEVLKVCRKLADFGEKLPTEELTTEQREEFFNRYRSKIGRLFIAPDIGTSEINNKPLFEQPTSPKLLHFSRRMPDPYLRPAIKKLQAPSGQNKLILERERIFEFRQQHPKVVFTKHNYCYKVCPIGSALRYNEHCKHSAGIYTYAGEKYIACLYYESALGGLPI